MNKQRVLGFRRNALILCLSVFLGWGVAAGESSGVAQRDDPFHIVSLELTFDNGKAYRVTEMNAKGPAYRLTMMTQGRGTLTGNWLLDGQEVGALYVVLMENRVVTLRRHRVPVLPTVTPGLHQLTLQFNDYEFPHTLPTLRYYVVNGGAIETLTPKTGAKIRVYQNEPAPVRLQWKWPRLNVDARTDYLYQLLITDMPPAFMTAEEMEGMWKPVGKETTYDFEPSPKKRKKKKWYYWQIRAVTREGEPLTIWEVASFKIVDKKKKDKK